MSRVRAILQRALLVPLSLIVLLVVAEIGLRIASHFVSRERGGSSAATTILCVGDSHTYGLHVMPALSYPARLQNDLDPQGATIGVVNYGVPGRNSGALLARLPEYLDRLNPDLVLVLVGFNDSWNFDSNGGESADAKDAQESPSWLAQLRVVRMFRILRMNLQGRKESGPKVVEKDGKLMIEENGALSPAATGGQAFGVIEGEALEARVKGNLQRIVAAVRAHGGKPVLLDYATENQKYFRDLNSTARSVARELEVPFIEIAIPFREAIARDGYQALFFDDDHPNARGNELFASLVAAALREQKLVPTVAASNANEDRSPAPSLTVSSLASLQARLNVRGPPLRDFQIAFSPRKDPPLVLRGVRLPIGDDPMLARCLEDLNLRGRTDQSGNANVECNLARIDARAGATLFGVVAFFGADAARPPKTSDAIEILVR